MHMNVLLQRLSLLFNLCFFVHVFLLYNSEREDDRAAAMMGVGGDRSASIDAFDYRQMADEEIGADYIGDPQTIYMITPTVHRSTRKADLIRMAQTIRQVPFLHWIVIEDAEQTRNSVRYILKRLITNYTYLAAVTPDHKKLGLRRPLNKGIFQRNVGLEYLRWRFRSRRANMPKGVVYFADDDNTYDLRLFDMMRETRKVAVWPVALVGGVKLEKPIRNPETGRLIGFDVGFAPKRRFAVDMAGFALSLNLVLSNTDGHFPLDTIRGYNEPALFDTFNLTYDDVQVFGLDVVTEDGFPEPLVWHTKTREVNVAKDKQNGTTADWEV